LPIEPILLGGFQQSGLRPGTEDVVLATGLFKALEIARIDLSATTQKLAGLRDQLEGELRRGWPDSVVLGDEATRLPQTLSIAFPGLDRQSLVMALDLAGVACSTGSACASGSSEPSRTLTAMSCSDTIIASAIRLSVSRLNTVREMVEAAQRILAVCHGLRSSKSG
jgi:cysteine desulfurase